MIIALSGALSLSVAMGIGRFAFTPLMPMMLQEGLIDIAGGSLLATANYVGYLVGALLCMALPSLLRRLGIAMPTNATMVRFGLAATVALTAAMAVNIPAIWPALRLLSGIISAVVFVYASGWCLKRLAEMNALQLAGFIYTGPGLGIALSGAVAPAISAAGGSAAVAWLAFGLLAVIASASIWRFFRPGTPVRMTGDAHGVKAVDHWTAEQMLLAFAYGLAGFGYIITATFLPVIAGEALGNSAWIAFFWPVFGLGVAVGAALTRAIPLGIDRRALLAACYVVQAMGVAATLMVPTVFGFMTGSALVGVPFTVITLFGMQEARRLRPVDATVFIALMTATYGIGQIAGPPLAASILAGSASHAAGFSLSLGVAAAALTAGAALYGLSMWLFPPPRHG
jgi:MFS family permease